MANMIYMINMYLFRDQFRLTPKELSSLKWFMAFIGTLYIKAWFRAASAMLLLQLEI